MIVMIIFGERISLGDGRPVIESLGSVTDIEHQRDPSILFGRWKSVQEFVGEEYERLGIINVEIDEDELLQRLPLNNLAPLKGRLVS